MRILIFLFLSITTFGQDWRDIDFASIARTASVQATSQTNMQAMTTACACDFTIPSSAYYVDIDKNTNANAYVISPKPGQTVCFADGQRADLEVHNIVGTAIAPIWFRSCGGTIFKAGFDKHMLFFSGSAFFKVFGDNGDGYGPIEITGGNAGLSVAKLSTDADIEFINFHDIGYVAFEAKTDPTCDNRTWRGGFIMRNIIFRNNTIRNCLDGEGVYIGESHYNSVGAIQPKPCPDGTSTAKEHQVIGVLVANNIIKGTGADGIQVGATTADCEIHDNDVSDYGKKNGWAQNAGIITNPGTVADVYNNRVDTGTGFGIQDQGPGGAKIHDNLILNPGQGGILSAIYPVEGMINLPATQIYNNTIVNAKGSALEYYAPVTFKNNIFQLATGAVAYKKGGSAGVLTESGNTQLSGISGKLDAIYAPVAGAVPAGVGYKPLPTVVKEAGSVELITTNGIDEWWITSPSGKRKKIE